ncbi:histidine kinase [Amycolatopsis sp. OK19-0408]|uniref:Histidine kinase n=1 Tax=Amycolatopsis iheyensis TaxID=2945988 RepID=A0A9X2SJ17_9PSEU|nr:histidine kinase [Amycolatopsis iheyensis]MCR6483548.1 histidine kinase [Amycolatopsis iheyensis]
MHAGVCLGIGVLGLLGPLRIVRDWPVALVACVFALTLIAVHLIGFGYRRIRFRGPALVLQAVLGLVPVAQLGTAWSVLSSFFVGSVLLVARPVVSVPVLVLVSGGVGILSGKAATAEMAFVDGLYGAVLTAAASAAVFGMAWFVRLAAEREDARRELAAHVVAEERMRFARDTHDLLGLSLSAITLKVELARRLVDAQPAQAKRELAELATMSRKALTDVRSVAAGHRETSLAEECRSATAVLRSAGVTVHFDQELPEQLPEPVAATFATVLRESATNVVRHSEASRCDLAVGVTRGEAWLQMVNDGVLPDRPGESEAEPGCGLRNLGHRVRLLGGELTAGTRPGGTHLVRATVPLEPFADRSRLRELVPGCLRAIRRRWRSGSRAPGCGR